MTGALTLLSGHVGQKPSCTVPLSEPICTAPLSEQKLMVLNPSLCPDIHSLQVLARNFFYDVPINQVLFKSYQFLHSYAVLETYIDYYDFDKVLFHRVPIAEPRVRAVYT